jgi:hypothetical protein
MIKRLAQLGMVLLAALPGCSTAEAPSKGPVMHTSFDFDSSTPDSSADAAGGAGGTEGGTADSGAYCQAAPGCEYTVGADLAPATTTLECFCADDVATSGCPATLNDATATVLPELPCLGHADGYAYVDRGCGFVTVGFDGLWGARWHYDEASGALVGAEHWGDVLTAPCPTAHFVGGTVPNCASMVRCTPCSGLTVVGEPVPVCP